MTTKIPVAVDRRGRLQRLLITGGSVGMWAHELPILVVFRRWLE